MQFTASTLHGASRGTRLNAPTINLRVEDIPKEIEHGIYACKAALDNGEFLDGVLHYGPKPVYKEGPSFEVHILDKVDLPFPENVTVDLRDRIRDVQDFSSEEALKEQIAEDIAAARAILSRDAQEA